MARQSLDSGSHGPSNSFDLKCPKDGGMMDKIDAHGIKLDRCVTCGAVWFDAKELEQLQRDKQAAESVDIGARTRSTAPIKTRNLRCPRDNEPMLDIEHPKQSHIMIMECGTCGGHLLDAGEFKDMAKFTLGEKIKNFFS
jgi:Zn-finger nucleic acid-binding protein